MKKHLISAGAFTLIIFGSLAIVASAQTATFGTVSFFKSPVVLTVNQTGGILMRGEIDSMNDGSLVIKSWGGNWVIKISQSTEIISQNKSLSDFKAGDFIGVSGAVIQGEPYTITADIIRLWGVFADNDKDGIPDVQDQNDDNDNLMDSQDIKPLDHDNDDINDADDADDDNDGVLDANDNHQFDQDNDNIPDSEDQDDNGNGILDGNEASVSQADNAAVSESGNNNQSGDNSFQNNGSESSGGDNSEESGNEDR